MMLARALAALLLWGGCSFDCNVPAPGTGSPSVRLERRLPSAPPVMPATPTAPPTAPTSPPQPGPPPGPPPRSMARTRPAAAPEGPPRDLPGPPEVFARWRPERALAALQGAWLTPGGFIGTWEAWEVAGDRVRIYDGRATEERELSLESPCSLKATRRHGAGFRSTTSVFTIRGAEVWKGLGSAGFRRGSEAVLCAHGRIFAFDGERCVAYRPPFGSPSFGGRPWQAVDTRCGFDRSEDGSEVFFYQHGDSEYPAYVIDDVLASWQLKATHSLRQPSFEAAKVARDAKRR